MIYTAEQFCTKTKITPEYLKEFILEGFPVETLHLDGKKYELYETYQVLLYFYAQGLICDGYRTWRAIDIATAWLDDLHQEAELQLIEKEMERELRDRELLDELSHDLREYAYWALTGHARPDGSDCCCAGDQGEEQGRGAATVPCALRGIQKQIVEVR
jgi:hypothetical protein